MKLPPLDEIGRYQVKEALGSGGSAIAYLAYDPLFKRDVTVKLLKSDDSALRKRFQKEIEILAGLEHPAIVPVYDFSEYEGKLFLVMRYMAGGSLGSRLQAGPLSLSEAGLILDRLAAALAAAHKRDVIHRDIKAANILLDEEGRAYLSDFGAAIVVGNERETVHGAVTGSPEYMAPEQITWKHDLSIQTDVYQLGVVLFEMLTGERPFTGDDVMAKHIHDPVPRVTAVNSDLPPACDDLFAKAMAKEPSERYATPDELAAALAKIVTDESMKHQSDENKPFNIEACYQQGMVAFEAENWKEAVSKLFQVIEADFEYEDAANKLKTARESLAEQRSAAAKQQGIEFTYQEADNHFQHERWGQAAAKFQEVVKQQSDFRDASEKLEEARKQEELDRLYKAAMGQCEKGEWETAVATFQKIQAIDVAYKEVAVKLQQAEEEVTLAEQYNKALESLTYGKELYYGSWFNRAKKQIQAIQEKRPGYRNVAAKLKEIEKQLALLELYEGATSYETKGDWTEAIKAYGDLLGQSPAYRDAASRLTAVKIKAKKEEIYQEGKTALEQRGWEKAIEQFKQCAGYLDADKLLLQAQKQKESAQKTNGELEQTNSKGSQMSNELTRLRQILVDHFDEEELKTLCFDLKIDYESLTGKGKAGKARDLVSYCKRYGRITDLEARVRKLRPHLFKNGPKLDDAVLRSDGSSPSPAVSDGGPDPITSQDVSLIKRLAQISPLTSLLGLAIAALIILLFSQPLGSLYQSLEIGAEGIIAIIAGIISIIAVLITQHPDKRQQQFAYFGLGFLVIMLAWLTISVAPKDNGSYRNPYRLVLTPTPTPPTAAQCLQNTQVELLVDSEEGRHPYKENETVSLKPGDVGLTILFDPDCSGLKPPITYQWSVSQGMLLETDNVQSTYTTPPDARKDALTIIVQVPEENNHTETFSFPIEIIKP